MLRSGEIKSKKINLASDETRMHSFSFFFYVKSFVNFVKTFSFGIIKLLHYRTPIKSRQLAVHFLRHWSGKQQIVLHVAFSKRRMSRTCLDNGRPNRVKMHCRDV